jgi:hypothetical protein
VLACYKLGIILEGTHARACAGLVDRSVGDWVEEVATRLSFNARISGAIGFMPPYMGERGVLLLKHRCPAREKSGSRPSRGSARTSERDHLRLRVGNQLPIALSRKGTSGMFRHLSSAWDCAETVRNAERQGLGCHTEMV